MKQSRCGLQRTRENPKLICFADMFIAFFIILTIALTVYFLSEKGVGSEAEVYYRGKLYQTINLNIDAEYNLVELDGSPTLSVKDGKIAIIKIECKNQICFNTGYTDAVNSRIVCAPNRIIIVVRNKRALVTGGF